MAIIPIEDFRFSLAVLADAGVLAKRDPASLSDLHLRHWAVYDVAGAEVLEQKRAEAIETAERTRLCLEATARAAAEAKVPTVPAVTQAHLEALLDGIGDGVAELVKRLTTRIKAVETANAELRNQIVELLADQAVKK